MGAPFTEAEDEFIRQARAGDDKLTNEQICIRLNRSKSGVERRLRFLGLVEKQIERYSPEDLARAVEMRTAGMSWSNIGRAINRDGNSLRDRVGETHPWLVDKRPATVRVRQEAATQSRHVALEMRCLRCERSFKSWSRTHNRICEACGRAPEHSLPVTW